MNQNKRIAKNTIFLYFKLVITTIIGLFTTRIVLLTLGADDYGLFVVVGGIVSMLNFISTAMLTTSYRYLAVEIGKGNNAHLNKVFNTVLVIHILLAILLIFVAEPIGIWYVKHHLNVSIDKIPDALFVLHFSILATAITIISVPFRGLISARENFIVRVVIDIIKAILNLILVLLLTIYVGNKLNAYAVIMFVVMTAPFLLLIIYNWIKERDSIKWRLNSNISDYLEILSFTGWALFGVIAYMGVRQGAAIIINLFFGTIINASFGIASQVNNFTMMFVRNLNQAAVPQIMKSYSSGDTQRSLNLVYSISKYAFFIMLTIAVPIILSMDTLLELWLKDVPKYTKQFSTLMIINGLIGVTSSGFDAAIQATGNIKKSQIWYSFILLITLPIACFMFKLNYPPYVITIIAIGATIVNRFVQINILSKITEFKFSKYLSSTILPTILVSLSSTPLFFLRYLFEKDVKGMVYFSILAIPFLLLSIYFLGLTRIEKNKISSQIIKLNLLKR